MPRLFINRLIKDSTGVIVSYYNPLVPQVFGDVVVFFNNREIAKEAECGSPENVTIAHWGTSFKENEPEDVLNMLDDIDAIIIVDPDGIPEECQKHYQQVREICS